MDPDHCIFIPGFGLAGYRSFGPEIQRVGPCKKINLIIGQNNSGKSNILRFLQDKYAKWIAGSSGGRVPSPEGLEAFRSNVTVNQAVSFLLQITPTKIAQWQQNERLRSYNVDGVVRGVLASGYLSVIAEGTWLDLRADVSSLHLFGPLAKSLGADKKLTGHLYNFALHCLNGGSSDREENGVSFLRWLMKETLAQTHPCVTVPSIRQPGTAEYKGGDHSGAEIIQRLAKLQHPAYNEQDKKADFRRVQQFLRDVTERPDAVLEVPDQRDTLIVDMDGQPFPLEGLGTGIHEVIILAAAATSLHGHVICIEEPEIHLHPLLQKKLLRYLDEQTDNQYFISTHSAHFLDHPGAAIFHVKLTDGGSKVTAAVEPSQKFAICADLGYRASDLLQTNCIIWVEGPSDRVYVREWIRLVDNSLVEGIDYSVMFYGGRLLSHLSPTDPEVEDFISLRLVNRNMVVVMDSDKTTAAKPINTTKQRIVDAWKGELGFAWVTAGREIENYVSPTAVIEALDALAANRGPHRPASRYQQCIQVTKGVPATDKVKFARWLVDEQKLTLNVLDLQDRIEQLRKFIQQSNHVVTKKLAASA